MSMRLLGKKLGMTQIFTEDGTLNPATIIKLGPNYVVQKKTMEKDGYGAIQIGFEPKPIKRTSQGEVGHAKSAGLNAMRFLRESRLDAKELEGFKPGDEIGPDYFETGQYVDVIGTSKGRGFAGVMKRHGMHGTASMTHGSHEVMRHAGSIGASATPARVFKGKKMAGRMGNARTTVQNLRVLDVRPEENIIIIKGAVPGCRNGLVLVQKSTKHAG